MIEKEKLFIEFEKHLLEDKKPSIYFNQIYKEKAVRETYPFTLLFRLGEVPQSVKHHPEGSVWEHTMLVLDYGAEKKGESKDVRVFMWSALLHDLGKATTTKIKQGERVTSYNHDKVGYHLVKEFLGEFIKDEEFVIKVATLVRWHMQVLFVVKNLPYADTKRMLLEVPLEEIALLSLCDRMGRGGMTEEKKEEELENIKKFIEKCNKKQNEHHN